MASLPRVLVVDDDPMVLETYAGALAAHREIDLCLASTGREALVCVAEKPVAALVLDHILPDMDGLTLLGKVRAKLGRRVPAVLLTAHLDGALKARAFVAGFDQCMTKPIDEDALRQVVATLLS